MPFASAFAAAAVLVLVSPLVPVRAQVAEAPTALRALPVFSADDLQVSVYTPKHVPVHELFAGVHNLLQRQFVVQENGPQQRLPQNLQLLGNSIVIYDTAGDSRRILSTLATLDRPAVPAPQISLTCSVLRATRDTGSEGLDPELVADLSRLVPFEHFDLLTSGIVTSSVPTGTKLRLEMLTTTPLRADLALDLQAYAEDARVLTIGKADFLLLDPEAPGPLATIASFSTRLTLRADEWVLLGASGPQPVFVVLRMSAGNGGPVPPDGDAR